MSALSRSRLAAACLLVAAAGWLTGIAATIAAAATATAAPDGLRRVAFVISIVASLGWLWASLVSRSVRQEHQRAACGDRARIAPQRPAARDEAAERARAPRAAQVASPPRHLSLVRAGSSTAPRR